MNRLVPLAAFALIALAAPLRAEDPRLVERPYDPAEIVRIEGKANVQATIRFADDELIENVAIGDSQTWQVTPNKRANLLFVKPLAERTATNMTVVTSNRTYFFDLVANPKVADPLYVLSFTYPDDPAKDAARVPQPAGQASEIEMAAATDPYAVVDPAELNFAWAGSGDRKLLPARIYDDGAATYLAWRAGTPVPAILVMDKAGTEGPVNFAVRGDVIVIDGVPREIVLRSGRDMARLDNNGPDRPAAELAKLDEVKR